MPRPLKVGITPELASEDVRSIVATIVNPLTNSTWDEWITSHPDATVFHTSAWARVLVDTYRHQPFYLRLAIRDESLAFVPVMELHSLLTRSRGICLPFSDSCAPLLVGNAGAEMIVRKLRQIGRERSWSYFEVRDGSILPDGPAASESYWSHKLDLTKGGAVLSSKFSSPAGRALRKAERSGLTVEIRTDTEAMTEFYSLHVRTRRRHGLPPQPLAFFSNIQKHIIGAGLGFIVIVGKGKRSVAAAIFFQLRQHALYKFGASDERWQEFRPNNLLIAEAIKHLAASSVSTLHFGRTDKSNEGLRRFKLSWGTDEEEISYGKFAISTDSWVQSRTHTSSFSNRIFRALPAPLNKLAGVLLYPHLD